MARFDIGSISLWVSPVSIMKCFVGIGWVATGSEAEIREYSIFCDEFLPFLISQDNELPIDDFCKISIRKIDEIMENRHLESNLVTRFSQRLKNTLKNQKNRENACLYAFRYTIWLTAWMNSPFGKIGNQAAQQIEKWGVQPLYEALGAAASFGNAVFGKFVPSLQAVCVQLDVIYQNECSELQFIETLLHEEIHAVIHARMGEDETRYELAWLNELAAVLTSQFAIESAARELQDGKISEQVERCLNRMRSRQQYGTLADAVLRGTENHLIVWRAWERIFDLPQEKKRNYARNSVITPILHEVGWNVEFPYMYDNKYVTVYV
ncbi:MAG: hypothetical protein AYK19_09695 [Theionarchaea archaeon DG-70-1]|nr:MAG: hypothetical protein AYK19_09695 [Theionarchaea archaeon DG-70-1]